MVWVRSGVAAGGAYVVEFDAGPDVAWSLPPDAAVRYTLAVMRVANTADHETAVVRLTTGRLGLAHDLAVQALTDMRADRPPYDDEATAPLLFRPSTRLRGDGGMYPAVIVAAPGLPDGMWPVRDARRHALAVLDVLATADLDAGLFRWLTAMVGLEPDPARAVVDDLRSYREPLD